MMNETGGIGWSMRLLCTLAISGLFLSACAPQPHRTGSLHHPGSPDIVSVVDDLEIREFVTVEGLKILRATKNRDRNGKFRFYLAKFKNPNWMGAAAGSHIIYVQINAARKAYLNRNLYLPDLRRILVHEIAHDLLNHPTTLKNSTAEELEADRLGIILWKRLGWDCSYWIQLYKIKQKKGITSKLYPTDLQLRQARDLCPEAEERKRTAVKKGPLEPELLQQQLKLLSPPDSK